MALRWGPADSTKIIDEHGDWLALADTEEIEFAAKTRRDLLVFTDRRVIVTDTQGFIRKKTEYSTVPYHSISRWSVESKKGLFDGADLKLWISSQTEPFLEAELQHDSSAKDVLAMFARHILTGAA